MKNMKEDAKISRKQFLGLVGTAAAALVVGRITGMVGSKSSIAMIKDADKDGYGSFPYGGLKA